jgi:hypothetical protein
VSIYENRDTFGYMNRLVDLGVVQVVFARDPATGYRPSRRAFGIYPKGGYSSLLVRWEHERTRWGMVRTLDVSCVHVEDKERFIEELKPDPTGIST